MSKFFRFLYHHWRFTLGIITLLIVAVSLRQLTKAIRSGGSPVKVSIESDHRISPTPALVCSIKGIGQWEFLSVQMEEMVDTTHERFLLSNEQLIRIYRGTIRLGIDLDKTEKDWFKTQGDTAILHLPPIQQLNARFIDEANTRTFYETGTWNSKAREELYQRARNRMLKRLRTSNAYAQAEANGREQVEALIHSLGFRHVEISFH